MPFSISGYAASENKDIQAFFNVTADGWLKIYGLALLRDGGITVAQLTWTRGRQKFYRPAIKILDDDLRELVTREIRAALNAHIATLPEGERELPPAPPKPRKQAAATPNVEPPNPPPPRSEAAPPPVKQAAVERPAAPPKPAARSVPRVTRTLLPFRSALLPALRKEVPIP
jgi:hypothetical protein